MTQQVKVLPVRVILHWPTPACTQCAGEVEEVAAKMYMCLSCGYVDSGRTKVLEMEAQCLT